MDERADGQMKGWKPDQRECVEKILANIKHSGSGYKTGVDLNPELHISQTNCIHLYYTFYSTFWFSPFESVVRLNEDRCRNQFSRSKLFWVGLNSNPIWLMRSTASEPGLRQDIFTLKSRRIHRNAMDYVTLLRGELLGLSLTLQLNG